MATPVVEFLREEYKIRKDFGLILTVLKWNDIILQIGVIGKKKKMPKLDIQSQFFT